MCALTPRADLTRVAGMRGSLGRRPGNRQQIMTKLNEFLDAHKMERPADPISVPRLVEVVTALPADQAFPALDLIRLACCDDDANGVAACETVAPALHSLLKKCVLAADSGRWVALRFSKRCPAILMLDR